MRIKLQLKKELHILNVLAENQKKVNSVHKATHFYTLLVIQSILFLEFKDSSLSSKLTFPVPKNSFRDLKGIYGR